MSIRAVVYVDVHFDTFRNIDLFHQGLYHLKVRVYRQKSEHSTSYAIPSGSLSGEPEVAQQKKSSLNHHRILPSHIDAESFSFSTPSFLVRYCEEEVELNAIGQFRIELSEAEIEDDNTPLLLDIHLMFADLSQHGGVDRFEERPDVATAEFKSVSSLRLKVHGAHKGVHAFCPIVFDEYHFCAANLAVHTCLVDFRMRVSSLHVARQSGRANCGDSVSYSECAFGDVGTTRVQLLQSCEDAYNRYLGGLAKRYSEQSSWFVHICKVCLTPEHIEVLADALDTPQLDLVDGVPLALLANRGDGAGGGSDVVGGKCIDLRSFLLGRLGVEPKGQGELEQRLAAGLAYDLNSVSCHFLQLWSKIQNVLLIISKEVMMLLRGSWESRIVEQMKAAVVREDTIDALTAKVPRSICDAHDREAARLRIEASRRTFVMHEGPFVEDPSVALDMETCPIVFDQRHCPPSAANRSDLSHDDGVSTNFDEAVAMPPLSLAPKLYRGVHLFVLVHGFQGNSFDMRLMKNNISLVYPEAVFLCSNSNEDNTDGDFEEMGIRLAQEVVNYICDWCPGSALGQLSFIAHSIGGVITRSALPLLQEYKDKMCTFLTLSSPHGGYFSNHLSLFSMGFKVLQTWRKSQCLTQLSMHDSSDLRQTCLYKLSKAKGFEFFKHVVLVSCASDQYGPFDSARVEIGGMLSSHASSETYAEMVHNIWAPVDPKHVFRLDVNFHIPDQNLDTFIGRAAHIQFLECQRIMKTIILNYSFLFR